nr:MAG TPA: nucleoid-associated protein [Caudoviricetes sp.]
MAVLLARGQITIAAIKDGADGAQGPQGKPGKDGVDGEAAVSILVEDAPLIFDTNDNGIVPVSIGKVAKVKVMKGNQNISNRCSNISSRDDLCVNCKCGAIQKDGYIEVNVSGSNIAKNGVVIDGVNRGNVSATSGYAVVQLTYNGVTYFAQVPFSANVAKFTGVVAFNNKSYKIQFDELSKNAATKDELKDATSKFEQTAREISLSVSEKTIGRRNLLRGSAFQRDDNNRVISNDARIEMNSGYQGTNCIKVIDDTDGTPHYIGVYWDGSQGGKSIKIEKGKKYTISCWYFTNDTNAIFCLEAIYTDKQTNGKRLGQVTYEASNYFSPKYGQWQLFTTVINTKDAKSNYIAFNFWEYCNNKAGRIEAYICRPMVEEGDTYYGWTLSQDDYDIIGANLIDNSRTLDAGGNVIEAKGQKALVGDAYELTASGSDDFNTFYRIKGSTFKLGVDYTISFEVRGDAKYMGVYVSYPVTNTKFTCYKEPQNGAMFEATGDGKTIGYVALVEAKELSKQQRVWGHFRFKDRLPEELYFQFPSNTEQTGVTSWNVTITKPKIEEGAVVTEYTERKSDLVDKASLKAAGVLVDAESVTLYGNQVHIKKDKNSSQYTLLIDNETGKVSAALIDAKKIVAEGVETQDLIISGSYRSPFSQVKAGKDMSYSDNVFLQGKKEWINSYTLKWDTTQSGRLVRLANYNWKGNVTSGYGKIKTPDANHFFFVNGEKVSQLYIAEQEMVEMLGIGDKTNFIGWAVVSRFFLNNYLNGMNVPILIMGKVEVSEALSDSSYIVSSNVRSFRDFGDYQGNNPTTVINASRVNTGVYRLALQPELAKFLSRVDIVVQATGIGNSLDGINPSMPIKATFSGIHFGSYPKYEGSYIEICTSDDRSKNEGSFFIEVKCMNFFGSNS